MTYKSLLTVIVVFLSVATISCKKKRNLPLDPEPKPIFYSLDLAFERQESVDGALLSMSAATDDKSVYVSGGTDYSDLWIYTPKSNQWTQVPLSWKRASTSVIYFKGKVFISGGNGNTGDRCRIDIYDIATKSINFKLFGDFQYGHQTYSAVVDDRYVFFYDRNYLYIYDSVSSNWETIDNPLPTRISPRAMAVIGSKLYFNDFEDPKSVRVFDFKTKTWLANSSFQDQSNTKMLAFDGRIYFYGNTSFSNLNFIDVLEVETGAWSKIALPGARAMYEMCIDPKSKSLIVTGGRVSEADPNGGTYHKMSNDLLIYSLYKKEWHETKLKTNRYGHTASLVGDHFIVHGGSAIFNSFPLVKLPTEIYVAKHNVIYQ